MTPTDFIVESYQEAGRVIVRSSVSPVSLQANRVKVNGFKAALRDAIAAATDFVFVGDVEVTFTWFVSDADRYQRHTAADLDNVLKPMLDAATGPIGIMFDDNQVQSIRASWMPPGAPGVGIELEFLALIPDQVTRREGTAFVQFEASTCYMLPGEAHAQWPALVAQLRKYFDSRTRLRTQGVDEAHVALSSPQIRPWHSQRLRMHGFNVLDATRDFQSLSVHRGNPLLREPARREPNPHADCPG
ncbi:MAG: RusA family crossover junction endodeoxyribonuclease [Microbacterium gubbeenense]|uniref:RusA family crossover junction endodeoxyribonuclease n=1 Tax=Microbacterium gubbeenense TaxID=159896 RepID=UPI003F97359F